MGMAAMDYFGVFGEKRPVPGGCNTLAASTGARCGRFDQSKAKPPSDVRFGFVSECEILRSTLTPWGARRFRPRAATGGADSTGCVNIRRIPVRRGISSRRHVAAGFHVRSAPTDDAETA